MLSELKLELRTEGNLGYLQSSILQSILMDRADKDYAESVHVTGLHPYSQFISSKNGLFWTIRTLNKEAYKGIIEPLLDPDFTGFDLNIRDQHVDIINKSITSKSYEDLMKTFNSDETEKYVRLEFESPTAFKSDSAYVFMPDTRHIFGSLMRKYSAASSSTDMTDEDTLQYITDHSSISDFRIRSTRFPLEGAQIPSFMGEVTIRFRGTDTMARYSKMLLEFGEFSGVGIKCGMGMGAIKIIERKK